jgi:hypothetical protein
MTRLTGSILESPVEGSRMRGLMAAFTRLLRNPWEEITSKRVGLGIKPSAKLGFVTVEAFILLVLAEYRKAGLRAMIKAKGLLPILLAVASLAVLGRRAHLIENLIAVPMIIGVTA